MNIDRYERDLDALIDKGEGLYNAMEMECYPQELPSLFKGNLGDEARERLQSLPPFVEAYQPWYSEAMALVRQLLPARLADFTRHYEKPKSRQRLTRENYTIEDYLQGLSITLSTEESCPALPRFEQQLNIVRSVRERFRSSLFDIRQLAQADLFDSELDAAKELAKKGFTRAAGAVAGVVLERHLKEVCGNHGVTVRKAKPTISDLNDALKNANAIDIPQWRSIQFLGDIRNRCDHANEAEPTADQVEDLMAGVAKVTKTVF